MWLHVSGWSDLPKKLNERSQTQWTHCKIPLTQTSRRLINGDTHQNGSQLPLGMRGFWSQATLECLAWMLFIQVCLIWKNWAWKMQISFLYRFSWWMIWMLLDMQYCLSGCFFFWRGVGVGCQHRWWHVEVPGLGMIYKPQLWPKLQLQRQCQILNPLHHRRNFLPRDFFFTPKQLSKQRSNWSGDLNPP